MRSATRDIDAEAQSLDRLGSSAQRSQGHVRGLMDAVVALSPTLIPLGAVGAAGIGGLATQFGFAAAAAGTAVLAFHGVGKALAAMNTYQAAPTAANLNKLNVELAKIGPAGRAFVKELDDLGPKLRQLQGAAQAGLFPGITSGIDHLLTLLPQVKRIISEVATTMGTLADETGASLAGPKFKNVFEYVERDAQPILTDLGHTIGHLVSGFAQLAVAFEPVELKFSHFLEGQAAKFDDWATNLSGTSGFKDFLSYLDRTGPEVGDALASIAKAMVAVTKAIAPIGGAELKAISDLADVLAKIANNPVGGKLLEAVTALYAIKKLMGFVPGAGTIGGLLGGGLTGKGLGSGFVGKALGGRGVVPVYVTNEGFGGVGGGAGKVPIGATLGATGFIAAILAQAAVGPSVSNYNNKHNIPNPTNQGGGPHPGLNNDTVIDLMKDYKKPLADLRGVYDVLGKISGVKLDKSGSLFGLQTDGDKVRTYSKAMGEVDDKLASIAQRHPDRALQAVQDASSQTGLSMARLSRLLPQTAAALGGFADSSKTGRRALGDLLGVTDDLTSKTLTFKGVLRGFPQPKVHITANTGAVAGAIAGVTGDLNKLNNKVARPQIIIGANLGAIAAVNAGLNQIGNRVVHPTVAAPRANGGYMGDGRVSGPGGPTEDRIPAMLSNGEYVINARAVNYYGVDTFDRLNAQMFAGGGHVKPKHKKQPRVKLNSVVAAQAGVNIAALQAQDAIASDQQQIDDLVAQLNEQQLVGKKGHKHYVYAAVGSARTALETQLRVAVAQLAQDKAALAAGTYDGGPNDPSSIDTSASDAAQQLADTRTQNATQLAGYADLFGRGTSAVSAERSVAKALQDIAAYGAAFQSLQAAGAGAGILNQIKNRGDSGDFVGATKLANSLLANPQILGTINNELNAVSALTSQISALTNPAGGFVQGGGNYNFNLLSDPSTLLADLTRTFGHIVDTKLNAALAS